MTGRNLRLVLAEATLVLLSLNFPSCSSESSDSFSLDNLVKEKIVPEIIDVKPERSFRVLFKSGVEAKMGNELTPTQVKDLPTFEYKAEPNQLYTIVMLDPDMPSREKPIARELLHLMITNIPGTDVSKGHQVADYVSAGPPMSTGLHRIVFLLFRQKNRLSDKMKLTNQARFKFSIKKFAKSFKLSAPIAANFYQTKWDLYVPILYAKLKG